MNVFISWSGNRSHEIALILKECLLAGLFKAMRLERAMYLATPILPGLP